MKKSRNLLLMIVLSCLIAAVSFSSGKEDMTGIFPEISLIKIPPENTPTKRKLEYLRKVEHFAYDFDKRIKDVILLYQDKTQDLSIANSDGLFVQGKKSDIILIIIALAEHKGTYSIGCSFIGGNIGLEIFDREAPGKIAKDAATLVLELLNPKPIPKEKLFIIFANKSGIFHECLGHPLVFKGKLNEQLTSQPLTVIDDTTIPDRVEKFKIIMKYRFFRKFNI